MCFKLHTRVPGYVLPECARTCSSVWQIKSTQFLNFIPQVIKVNTNFHSSTPLQTQKQEKLVKGYNSKSVQTMTLIAVCPRKCCVDTYGSACQFLDGKFIDKSIQLCQRVVSNDFIQLSVSHYQGNSAWHTCVQLQVLAFSKHLSSKRPK